MIRWIANRMKWKNQKARVKNLAKNEIKPNMALLESD